jgi:hypothetical protein
LHLTGAGAKPVRGYQKDEFGFGVYGAAALEYAIIQELGVQFEVGGLWLAEGEPSSLGYPTDWSWADSFFVGGRARPFASSYDGKSAASAAGLWLSAAGGVVLTGDLVRSGLDAGLGWDLLFNRGRLGVGPMVGYCMFSRATSRHVLKTPACCLRRAHGAVRGSIAAKVCRDDDRDGDGIKNSLDACPDAPEDFDKFRTRMAAPTTTIATASGRRRQVSHGPEDIDSIRTKTAAPTRTTVPTGSWTSMICPDEKT